MRESAMQEIIPAVDRELIKKELTEDRLIRRTNYADNLIYIVDAQNAPNVLREIGRLREISFRDAGGGTGLELDLDEFDMEPGSFQQLLVWNPQDEEIVGGYRFIHGKDMMGVSGKEIHSPTLHLFQISDQFIERYLPYTIELGRSFVQPIYQPTNNFRKGIYSLDNIWDGLGAIYKSRDDIRYFFGKITMYPQFNPKARDLILYFMKKYFGDRERLVWPFEPIIPVTPEAEMEHLFPNGSYDADYKILIQQVRALGEHIPPLVNAYMSLTPTMKYFGTSLNKEFGMVEESGILITIDDIYDIKIERHLTIKE